ncbi:MAG: PP2C family protein-serine/threonine phosphatase [Bacteroidales bacterium]|nr:PP2C family protein-serine/threonine phosphatase [Bacteroidales bacterium]
MGRKSFSSRLSWRIIGIVSVIIVTMLVIVAIVSHQLIAEEATRATQHILHGTISDIEKPLNEVEVVTKTVAAHTLSMMGTDANGKSANAAGVDPMEQLVKYTVEGDSLVCGSYVIVPSCIGNLIYYGCELPDGDVAAGSMVDDAMNSPADMLVTTAKEKKDAFWIPPHKSLVDSGKMVASYCELVYLPGTEQLACIVVSDLGVDWMEQMVEELRPYKNSLTTISCSEDCIVGIKDTAIIAQIRKSFAEDKELAALGEDMKLGKDSIRRRIGKGRTLSFVVYGPLHNGWMVSIVCQYRDVLERSSRMHLNLIMIGLLGLVVLFFACRRSIRRMTRPITELSESALNIAKGNFNAKLPEIKSQDEMLHLRDSFMYMQNSIADYIEELKTTTRANERMESELNVARNIQMGMLHTDFPPQLYALLRPAKEVGGDLYDFVLKDDHLYFAIGDVSGKGVPASLMMAITRASLRFVAGLGLPMDQTMNRINNCVTDTNSNNMFVTLFSARIDLKTGRMEYCNAGHNPIIIVPPDGEPYFLKAKANLAVGLFSDFPYEAESIDLKPGTRVVAYTDGVNEAEKADKSMYGNDRLLAYVSSPKVRASATTEREVVEGLLESVTAFTDGNPQNDDITIMSVKI